MCVLSWESRRSRKSDESVRRERRDEESEDREVRCLQSVCCRVRDGGEREKGEQREIEA